MKRLIAAAIAIALAVPALTYAQSKLTGKWHGETSQGSQIDLDVKATDTTVTGTFSRNGEASTISEGKVKNGGSAGAASFTFKATLDSQLEGFSGEINGEEVRLWPDRLGRDRAVHMKRVTK